MSYERDSCAALDLEPDTRLLWFGGRFHQSMESIEDDAELFVVFLFQLIDFAREFCMTRKHVAEANERAHNLNIHSHRAAAAEDAGEHGDALFRECIRQVATTATAFF